MATRNTPASFTLEEWRVEFNELATDVGDINGGITGSVAAGTPTYTTVENALDALVTDINSIVDGSYTFTGDVTIDANLEVTGNITLGGNITVGDADTDTVTFDADITSNFVPDATATYDIGASGKEWRNIYFSGNLIDENGVELSMPTTGGTVATQGFGIAVAVALG
jgi:hypothetical protein